jgi:hypothetical protein
MTERPREDTAQETRDAHVSRRDVLRVFVAATSAAAFTWTPDEVARAARLREPGGHTRETQTPGFFSPHEWETVRVLVDIMIPRDARSGSATDAGVPEFMDFIMLDGDNERRQTAMRGGLAWLDVECRERFDHDFLSCTEEERTAVLDDIAYPDRAATSRSQGVAFFNSFRDLTASGFWSSKMGVMDLEYMGNTALGEWTGCPEEQLRKLGVESK